MLINVNTELGAKDLLNNRMAYVAVSRGAQDALLFTSDSDKLPIALGHEVSQQSAHMAQREIEASLAMPQPESILNIGRGFGFGMRVTYMRISLRFRIATTREEVLLFSSW
ncbi:hypothetical protein [Acidipila sp. EB88]|uniref:hypothetical protein n=1 Tax=Acidipila sp. EB88 TaxID=2305226 RepID=UPI0018F2E933|nr:hypothetical protein [Acidipila sp. EB88]